MSRGSLSDRDILENFPDILAANYRKYLDLRAPRKRIATALHIYNMSMRTLTVILVSQYLLIDRERISDPGLNELLLRRFPHATHDFWKDLFFAMLQAYQEKRAYFFMPELYDFYWNTESFPHRRRGEIESLFSRMTEITSNFRHGHRLASDEELATEVDGHLREILGELSFLSSYQLIEVVKTEDNIFHYILHRGLQTSYHSEALGDEEDIEIGRIYVRNPKGKFLYLHPLFIPWAHQEIHNKAELAIYDHVLRARLYYLHTLLADTFDIERFISNFLDLLRIVEETKQKRQRAESLTWWQLRDTSHKITQLRMSGMEKASFKSDLYVERAAARTSVERFLKSEKKCFVLLGRSGVGKSSFLLALSEQLYQDNDDIAFFLYNGANLTAEPPLTEKIHQDVADHVQSSRNSREEIWSRIDSIEDINGKLVVLCIDAINESRQASRLLAQLNDLLQRSHNWLKVILGSRPVTWRFITKEFPLAEALFYRDRERESLELSSRFEASFVMRGFSQVEVAQAYEKYRIKYKIDTAYEALSPGVREMLQDPLNMHLISEIHKGATIPTSLDSKDLIEHYIASLLRYQRLSREDLRFLERSVIPIMTRGTYRNFFADEDFGEVKIWDQIYSRQRLANGRRTNQSYLNLVDTEILVSREEGIHHSFGFKHERFYEFFMGRNIIQKCSEQEDAITYIQPLIAETRRVPFLWGAIRYALVALAELQGYGIVLSLCYTESQKTAELMSDVLITLGQANRSDTESLLWKLARPPKGNAEPVRSGSDAWTERCVINAHKICISASSALKLHEILRTMVQHKHPTVRTTAVRYIYYMWKTEPEYGFSILEAIARKPMTGLVQLVAHARSLEVVFGLSLLFFFDDSGNQAHTHRIQRIWQGLVGNLLFRDHPGRRKSIFTPFRRALGPLWRKAFIWYLRRRLFISLRQLSHGNAMNYEDLDQAIRMSQGERDLYLRLLEHADRQVQLGVEDLERDLLKTLPIKNVLIDRVVTTLLIARLSEDPRGFLPFLKRFFHEARSDTQPNPYLDIVCFALGMVIDREPGLSEEVYNFFVEAIEEYRRYYFEGDRRYIPGLHRDLWRHDYLGGYLLFEHVRKGRIESRLFEGRIDAALNAGDDLFFRRVFEDELPFIAIESRRPEIAFEVLRILMRRDRPEINNPLPLFLSRMYAFYPDDVEIFMKEQELSDDIRLRARTHEAEETLGTLLSFPVIRFIRDDLLIGSEALQGRFIEGLRRAVKCKSIGEWADFIVGYTVNLIYGEKVL